MDHQKHLSRGMLEYCWHSLVALEAHLLNQLLEVFTPSQSCISALANI